MRPILFAALFAGLIATANGAELPFEGRWETVEPTEIDCEFPLEITRASVVFGAFDGCDVAKWSSGETNGGPTWTADALCDPNHDPTSGGAATPLPIAARLSFLLNDDDRLLVGFETQELAHTTTYSRCE